MSTDMVVIEASRWLGTPYHNHARLLGVGVDCANLLCAVYEACGRVGHVDPGHYPPAWHLHRGEEVFLDWLERVGAKRVDEPQPGDAAVWRFGRTFSHGGIVAEGGQVIHAYLGRGVILSALDQEPLAGRPVQFWRL